MNFDIPKDILHKLSTTGDVFRQVLVGKFDKNEKSKEPPVDLVLEKMADNVVKIFVTCKYSTNC